jgi:hypothetical protein
MFPIRNFIIPLSIIVAVLSAAALYSVSVLPVETTYADSSVEPAGPEYTLTMATTDNLQIEPEPVEALDLIMPLDPPPTQPEIIPIINREPAQDLGWPNAVGSSHLLTPWSIADLDGSSNSNGATWQATVSISVVDAFGNPVTNASVLGAWNDNTTVGCITDSRGQCSLTSSQVQIGQVNSLSFTVSNIRCLKSSLYTYQATRNTDPDLDSNGTTITISGPLY